MRAIHAVAFAVALLSQPANAGVPEAIDAFILPGFARFSAAATDLARAAEADCIPTALKPPFNAAFDAWMTVGALHLGPSENAAHAVAFWPDTRGFTPRALQGLIEAENTVIDSAESFAEVSIAGRGLFALEMMLYDEGFDAYGPDSYACRLVQRLATDLAAQATALDTAWRDDFAATLLTAGAADNPTFLSEGEALRALYTQVVSGLEFTADSRIGRPMGTFDQPRPERAEAWRSGRSLVNVLAEAEAAVALARRLIDAELPLTDAALDSAKDAASKIDDPGFQDVGDASARFKLEVLDQKIEGIIDAVEQEVGLVLGLQPGFNSQDGD